MAKTYYFSVAKHAHDIEYYHNHLYNVMHDMEVGTIPMDAKLYDRMYDMFYGPLMDLYEAILNSNNGYTVQLTGPQIALAKRIVFWASERRANHCKPEYRKYC